MPPIEVVPPIGPNLSMPQRKLGSSDAIHDIFTPQIIESPQLFTLMVQAVVDMLSTEETSIRRFLPDSESIDDIAAHIRGRYVKRFAKFTTTDFSHHCGMKLSG